MGFLKLLWDFITRNPFIAVPMLIGIAYALLVASGAIDCETRMRIAVNPNSVQCD